MEIKNFDDLPVTTMTVIVALSGKVNIKAVHHFLPITLIEVSCSKNASKCKLPHVKTPNNLITVASSEGVRGIVKSHKAPFKNSVSIDVSTSIKNVNLKLAPNTMQMCGAISLEHAREAANYIINHINHCQKFVNKINENPTLFMNTVNWVKRHSRGELDESDPDQKEYSVVMPESTVPDDVSGELVEFLMSYPLSDVKHHSVLCAKLSFIQKLKDLVEEPIKIQKISEAMINYNFSLGFLVNRSMLNQKMNKRRSCDCDRKCECPAFISRYNNALSNNVTVELPYKRGPNDHIPKRRENDVPRHTFLVYKSGSVTLSSKNQKEMKIAYYKFMKSIKNIKDQITLIGK